MGCEAGPAANSSGPRAVLRRHALRAARQRTLEPTGSTVGPVPYSGPGRRRHHHGDVSVGSRLRLRWRGRCPAGGHRPDGRVVRRGDRRRAPAEAAGSPPCARGRPLGAGRPPPARTTTPRPEPEGRSRGGGCPAERCQVAPRVRLVERVLVVGAWLVSTSARGGARNAVSASSIGRRSAGGRGPPATHERPGPGRVSRSVHEGGRAAAFAGPQPSARRRQQGLAWLATYVFLAKNDIEIDATRRTTWWSPSRPAPSMTSARSPRPSRRSPAGLGTESGNRSSAMVDGDAGPLLNNRRRHRPDRPETARRRRG